MPVFATPLATVGVAGSGSPVAVAVAVGVGVAVAVAGCDPQAMFVLGQSLCADGDEPGVGDRLFDERAIGIALERLTQASPSVA